MEERISIITLGVRNMPVSIRFYRDGLGFRTVAGDDADWAIFKTGGTRLALFPVDRLAAEIGAHDPGAGIGGITLAHNVRSREEVDAVINEAVAAGATLLKAPCEAEWGGYSGYFGDPDGHPWEVAWGDAWEFDDEGTLWGSSLGPVPGRGDSGG